MGLVLAQYSTVKNREGERKEKQCNASEYYADAKIMFMALVLYTCYLNVCTAQQRTAIRGFPSPPDCAFSLSITAQDKSFFFLLFF